MNTPVVDRALDTTDNDLIGPDEAPRPWVLVVDDDELLLRSVQRILRTKYDVVAISNPYRALVSIEEEGPFSAIICDLTMPGLDGIDVLETARDGAPETPRILLTGNATLPASIDAVNRGRISNFLTKPVSPDELLPRWSGEAEVAHRELLAEFDQGATILEGSADALLESLAVANPPALRLTRRVQAIVAGHLDRHDRPDRWELQLAAKLCYVGAGALTLDAGDGEPDTGGLDDELLGGCVAGLTVDIVDRLPRLAAVGDILRHHRAPDRAGADDPAPFGARLLHLATRLAEAEARTSSTFEAAAELRSRELFGDAELLEELLAVVLAEADRPIDLTSEPLCLNPLSRRRN